MTQTRVIYYIVPCLTPFTEALRSGIVRKDLLKYASTRVSTVIYEWWGHFTLGTAQGLLPYKIVCWRQY